MVVDQHVQTVVEFPAQLLCVELSTFAVSAQDLLVQRYLEPAMDY